MSSSLSLHSTYLGQIKHWHSKTQNPCFLFIQICFNTMGIAPEEPATGQCVQMKCPSVLYSFTACSTWRVGGTCCISFGFYTCCFLHMYLLFTTRQWDVPFLHIGPNKKCLEDSKPSAIPLSKLQICLLMLLINLLIGVSEM